MSYYEWAMIMYETYAKQNDMEQAEYYYKMAQRAKANEAVAEAIPDLFHE